VSGGTLVGMPKIPPPVYVVAGLLAQHLLAPKRRPGPVRLAAATCVGVTGIGLLTSATMAFRRHHTTVNPISPEKASTVVDEGVFGLTRNPMYVGMAGVLSAHAIARGGLLTWLPAAGFVAVIDRVQILAEERAMRANFGAAYDDYVRRVPRWVPGT
jgi:protein-S-isoprenylcysteine O-methyltransferase Ste14